MEIDNLEKKKAFYAGLTERQRRHYAALESNHLGHGGLKKVCEAFEIDPVTVRKGKRELADGLDLEVGRIRRKGGGRKKNQPAG